MIVEIDYYSAAVAFIILIGTFYFLKRRRIEFQYCMMWIMVSFFLIIGVSNNGSVKYASNIETKASQPLMIYFTYIFMCIFIIFYLTLVISNMQKKIIRLTQEVGILKNTIEGHGKK